MTTTFKSEQKRGYQEGSQKIELLRAQWPKAFPAKSHEVRPLAAGASQAVIEAFGWTRPYARAVLMVWKLRPAYCQATLRYKHRINLDGSVSEQEVDDRARALASERLEKIAARRAKETEKHTARPEATEEGAQPQAPEPTAAAVSREKPETAAPSEPSKPRKLLVTGSAAMEAALKRRLASGPMTTEVLKTVPAPSSGRPRRQQQAR
jgi:sRNA-binding protein